MQTWYHVPTYGPEGKNVPFRLAGAAGKARQDLYYFFDQIGLSPIYDSIFQWPDEPDNINQARIDAMLSGVKKGDVVFSVYPNGTNSNIHNDFFMRQVRERGAKLVAYIHDINYFRGNWSDQKNGIINLPFAWLISNSLNQYDGIVASTMPEAQRLRKDFHFQGPISIQGPHGYFSNIDPSARLLSNELIFAGSLEKSAYINELIDNSQKIKFNVYGGNSGERPDNTIEDSDENIEFFGKLDPEAIVYSLKGSFGLVWDSDSYPKVTGGLGFYEEINSPHKLSLYLAAGLPIITWNKNAFASFIIDNNIGWLIDDLTQVQDLILSISEDDYNSKIKSLRKISQLIRDGFYPKNAVLDMVRMLNEKDVY